MLSTYEESKNSKKEIEYPHKAFRFVMNTRSGADDRT